MNLSELDKPFKPNEVEWRIGQSGVGHGGKVWAKVLAYITNRAIMDRLDDVCGKENWHNEYRPGPQGGVICGISILISGQWVTKWDGAENTDIESVKGGLSDSMKRAAVQWGIGRYLYQLEEGWAETSTEQQRGGDWQMATAKKGKDDRDGTRFWWKPPQLPGWAQPAADKRPAAKPNTAGADAAESKPAATSQDTPPADKPKPANMQRYNKAASIIAAESDPTKLLQLLAGVKTCKADGTFSQDMADTLALECYRKAFAGADAETRATVKEDFVAACNAGVLSDKAMDEIEHAFAERTAA